MPLFTIITPTYNCAAKLASTIESVLVQDCSDYEYLLMDGASSDDTKTLIDEFCLTHPTLRGFSEKDDGIYDAMNKGIRRATGRFIYFLGAGDRLRPGVLATMVAEMAKLPPQGEKALPVFLYGDVQWAAYAHLYDGRFDRFKLLKRNICHQAIFYQRSLFEKMGEYNLRYKSLADWEFNIRCFNDRGIAKHYVPVLVADFEGGGTSENIPDAEFLEDLRVLKLKQYGLILTLLMHLKFLLFHPRILVREPLRQVRRWLHSRAVSKGKVS